MPEQNVKQAWLIPSANSIPNPLGTAPGWWVRQSDGDRERSLVAMPGVPFEMKRMWEREIEPALAKVTGTLIVSRILKTMGLGESTAEAMVTDLMNGSNPTLAPYAKSDGVHLRITAKAQDRDTAEAMIAELEQQVRERLGDAVYGVDDDTPPSVVMRLLDVTGERVAVFESGEGALGCVTSRLGVSERVVIVPGHEAKLETNEELEAEAQAILTREATNLVMIVAVRQESVGDSGRTVKFDAHIALADARGVRTVRQSWQTAHSEVTRLVGLAALNVLRRHLLRIAEAAKLERGT